MQLITKDIRFKLATACCAVLGTGANAETGSDSGTSSVDFGVLSYSESDGRVKALEPMVILKQLFPDESVLSLRLTLDTLSGASPNGALPSKSAQTFTTPSGNAGGQSGGGNADEDGEDDDEESGAGGSYTSKPGELPLDPNFKDTRKAVAASYTYPWMTDSKLTVGGAYSTEIDFTSYSANIGVSQDLFQKNTTLSVSANFEHDDISAIGSTPVPMTLYADELRQGDQTKTVNTWVFGVTQVLNRRWLTHVNYGIDKASGYQTDPYKIVSELDTIGNVSGYIYEGRPDQRTRKSIYWENKIAVGNDVLDIAYRKMSDDWSIKSDTIDMRYRWQLMRNFYLEPHYRIYRQTAADFYRLYLNDAASTPEYASADPRLGAFDANTLGIKAGYLFGGNNEVNFRIEQYKQEGRDLPSNLPTRLQGLDLYPGLTALILQAGVHFEF